MDFQEGIYANAYTQIVQHIYAAASLVFNILSAKAAEEEKEQIIKHGRPRTELKVSGDESWTK